MKSLLSATHRERNGRNIIFRAPPPLLEGPQKGRFGRIETAVLVTYREKYIREGMSDLTLSLIIAHVLGRGVHSIEDKIKKMIEDKKIPPNPNTNADLENGWREIEGYITKDLKLNPNQARAALCSFIFYYTANTDPTKTTERTHERPVTKHRRKKPTTTHRTRTSPRKTQKPPKRQSRKTATASRRRETHVSAKPKRKTPATAPKKKTAVKAKPRPPPRTRREEPSAFTFELKTTDQPTQTRVFTPKKLKLVNNGRDKLMQFGLLDSSIKRILSIEIGMSIKLVGQIIDELIRTGKHNPNSDAKADSEMSTIITRRREEMGRGRSDAQIAALIASETDRDSKVVRLTIMRLVDNGVCKANPI
jgi:hypothetical protein